MFFGNLVCILAVSYIKWMFHKLLRRNIPAGEFQLPASELDHPESYQEHVSKESGKTPKDSKAADIERLTVKVTQITCPLLSFWILFVAIVFVTAVDLSILHGMYIFAEIVGHRFGAREANSHEPVHYVDVWQHNLHLSHHDGRHDVLQANPSAL